MAEWHITLNFTVECDEDTVPRGDATRFGQSMQGSVERVVGGNGQYRGKPIKTTAVHLASISRYS